MRPKTVCTRKKPSCAFALENSPSLDAPRIVVAGAGAVGCYVGGLLSAAGHNVILLARTRIAHELRAHGLTLTGFDGAAHRVDTDAISLSERPTCLGDADIILVTVKSGDTEIMARTIADHAAPHAIVVSLQNGTDNAGILRTVLPQTDVRAGIVAFNVVPMGQGCFHRATSGDIIVEAGPVSVAKTLNSDLLTIHESNQITRLQWGKFLFNLNNGLNALSGLPLHDQLRDPAWRRLMADQWAEALRVLRANGVRPLSAAPVPVGFVPTLMRLPAPIFMRIAGSILRMDAQARTSMSYDLMAHRKTEIDAFQGQVVRMGAQVGRATPISAMVVDVIKTVEIANQGLPNLPVAALRREI